jgi:hypothetical protein
MNEIEQAIATLKKVAAAMTDAAADAKLAVPSPDAMHLKHAAHILTFAAQILETFQQARDKARLLEN